MKLGKKKNSDDSENPSNPDGKQSPQRGKKAGKAGGPSRKRLDSVSTSQALVVVLAGAVSAALIYFLLIVPAETRRYDMQASLEADAAAVRINQQLALLQSTVEGMAAQDYVRAALAGEVSMAESTEDLVGILPGIEAVHLFGYGNIPRSASEPTLGFAGLDLARQAEAGSRLYPDAFPRDGQWYLQMAAPVRNPQSRALAGTLLVVFSTAQLQPVMTVVNQQLGGQLALAQSVNDSSRTIFSQGSGNGPVQSRDLANPDWQLLYRPASAPAPLVDSVLAIVLVVVPALLAAIFVWLLLGRAQQGLRQDIAALIQWAHKAFGGERVKPPSLKWDMVASTAEVLHRLAQGVEKRVVKAGETARPKPQGSDSVAKPEAAEPLFQEKDMLDIDMLDGDDDVLGFGGSGGAQNRPQVEEMQLPDAEVSGSIFRAYDIRGIVGETLTPDIVGVIGRAIGSEAMARGIASLCIGCDGRHSSPELADALARGILSTGCDVIHVGAVPTPVLYFATHELGNGSGVMVTGSHNPANYNGLKIMLGGEALYGDAIQKLLKRIRTGDFTSGDGAQSSEDVRRAYLDRIVDDIAVAAPLKVVVDAGNGIAGELAPLLIEELGCEVIPLYCEVDGDFPNHHPDPGKPENLADLIERVKTEGADIGLAFDGDGDRLGVVTNTGKIIWPDRLLMLFARDVVSRNPGADVIYDVKCSRRLASVISEAGGRPVMWKTGHSLIKAKMRETGALLAGEMSGHIFFGERWLGFDDGLYSAARLLEILGIEDRQCSEVFEDFPEDVSTPELNVDVTEDTKFDLVERLGREGNFGDASISTIDGIRVEYTDGWGLCRASNTTPVLVLRFEAETGEALERIKAVFREQLKKTAPDLVAEF